MYSVLRVASLVVLLSSSCGVFWSKKKKTASCQDGQCNQNVVVSEFPIKLSSIIVLSMQLQVFNNGDWVDGKSVSLTPSECSTNKDLGLFNPFKFTLVSDGLLQAKWFVQRLVWLLHAHCLVHGELE